tara:strand:+ start:9558 stop:12398 length:2841 start_codon:yes stop_codon:yes gene_type:complete
MAFNRIYSLILFIALTTVAAKAQKTPLSFDDYTTWKNIGRNGISSDGTIFFYEIKPLTFGDYQLVYQQLNIQKTDTLNRSKYIRLSPANDYMAYNITPPYDTLKALKLKDTPKKDLPKDTFALLPFNKDTLYTFTDKLHAEFPTENGNWLAFTLKKWDDPKEEKTPSKKKKGFLFFKKDKKQPKNNSKKKKDHKTHPLIVLQPSTGALFHFENVNDFNFDKNGDYLAFTTLYGDSIDSSGVFIFNCTSQTIDTLVIKQGQFQKPVANEKGSSWAFFHTSDTTKNKSYDLQLYYNGQVTTIVDSLTTGIPTGYCPSLNHTPSFSKAGDKLFLGTAEIPTEAEDDSLLSTEKAKLDVWSWTDLQLQPHQLITKKQDEKQTYLAVYHIQQKKFIQLANDTIENIRTFDHGNTNIGLGTASKSYEVSYSWEYPWKKDYYSINLTTGEANLILKEHGHNTSFCPTGKYFVWYDAEKDHWLSKNLKTDSVTVLTQELKTNGVKLYNTESEVPALPYAYGVTGWTKDERLLLNTENDIYLIDPSGKQKTENLTAGFHFKDAQFTFNNPDRTSTFINTDTTLLFIAQNRKTNENRIYAKSDTNYHLLYQKDAMIYSLKKAKDTTLYSFRESTYQHYPDVSIFNVNDDLKSPIVKKELTNINEQRETKLWGTVEKYYWNDFNNTSQKGLLFKPENFDSTKTYPVIIYFYEKNFNTEHYPRSFRPSPSTISIPFYNSNGYIVFVPDIHYVTGRPGQDAYDAIVSGAQSISKLPYVDAAKMALQGQSWGGYQTAFLVTQTNLFAAAMAGAPVSNMTSAYGGIRWGSGLSRMFQYEQTQSRIGGTLWDSWDNYRDNSPIYFLPQVETPLLIMHNDGDGAVPWYQGIEMFVGLRRLGKPAWLLNYNGDEHNLMKMPNRIDLSKRMFGFFNHYLKDQPAPRWMTDGVPAIDKGIDYGLDN